MKNYNNQCKLVSKPKWFNQFSDSINDPVKLLEYLKLDNNANLKKGIKAKYLFPFRIPKVFMKRISLKDPNDPLLRQVITSIEEFKKNKKFSRDPIAEHKTLVPGLLHKYKNRVLLLLKDYCAINCRFCFRRYFPYRNNVVNKKNLFQIIEYINDHKEIDEVILSGGDPLSATDNELKKIIYSLENINHLKTLRIHSRLISLIPSRITKEFRIILRKCRLKIVIVTHINHEKEVDKSFFRYFKHLNKTNIILLNQSVLLRGVNDNPETLVSLNKMLFSCGILPYYLHILDKVQGTKHFLVEIKKAKEIMKQLSKKLPGYLVPRLVKDTGDCKLIISVK